jgi:hypothetical protein
MRKKEEKLPSANLISRNLFFFLYNTFQQLCEFRVYQKLGVSSGDLKFPTNRIEMKRKLSKTALSCEEEKF